MGERLVVLKLRKGKVIEVKVKDVLYTGKDTGKKSHQVKVNG